MTEFAESIFRGRVTGGCHGGDLIYQVYVSGGMTSRPKMAPRWALQGAGGEAQAYGGREGRVIEKRPSGWLMEGGKRERGRRGTARFRIKHLSLLILADTHFQPGAYTMKQK